MISRADAGDVGVGTCVRRSPLGRSLFVVTVADVGGVSPGPDMLSS